MNESNMIDFAVLFLCSMLSQISICFVSFSIIMDYSRFLTFGSIQPLIVPF